MDLSPQSKQELHKALLSAYRSMPELERMLAFKLGIRMQDVILPAPLREVTFKLIDWAEAEGQVDQLIEGAYSHNSGNALLRKFYKERFALVQQEDLPELESILFPNNHFQDIAHWRGRLHEIESRVCQIGIEGHGSGTGFLVAADVVLTNDHVIRDVRENKIPPTQVRLHFDYKRGEDGIKVEESTEYALDGDWLIDFSPNDPSDFEPAGSREPVPGHLDHALLRVAGKPGDEIKNGHRRGYIPMPNVGRKLTPQMPLIIVQHPRDELGLKPALVQPMKIAIDTQGIIGLNASATRVSYRTNTLLGSSGSPCFNMDLELVAMHQMGAKAQGFNQGIPISTLRAHLEKKGLLHFLGKASP